MINQIDPNNEDVHKVGSDQLAEFRRGAVPMVAASCGKVWAPTQFDGSKKGRCPVCFPHVPNRFAIAA